MIRKFKQSIVALADRFGYQISKKPKFPRPLELSHFESCLHVLTNMRDTLNIVQVGANDGAINDPLYRFLSTYPACTKVILCEPQEYLVPELEKTYQFHHAKYIFNGAIGPESSLKLYRIRRDCWKDLSVPYARGWPEYRAPTGVTSASYEHVIAWVQNFYKGRLHPKNVVESVTVECLNMSALLKRASLFNSIDVLQVDAEGFDDQVIYASEIGRFLPLIVNFESANLPLQRSKQLREFLAKQGYIFSQHGIDGLAIRTIGVQ